tara:strand:- start:226 stop:561 length:336 start_codon:yes stop_codon:yes gene_type:complete
MTKVRFVEAWYRTVMRWDLESIAQENNFKVEDIDNIYVAKWVTLFIYLKNGEVHTVESKDSDLYDNTDWKYPLDELFLDEDSNVINFEEEEPNKDTQQDYLIQEVTNKNLN